MCLQTLFSYIQVKFRNLFCFRYIILIGFLLSLLVDIVKYVSMLWAFSESGLKLRWCSSLFVQYGQTSIHILSYLRHLEELGVITFLGYL